MDSVVGAPEDADFRTDADVEWLASVRV